MGGSVDRGEPFKRSGMLRGLFIQPEELTEKRGMLTNIQTKFEFTDVSRPILKVSEIVLSYFPFCIAGPLEFSSTGRITNPAMISSDEHFVFS